jgi:hypothetical protein
MLPAITTGDLFTVGGKKNNIINYRNNSEHHNGKISQLPFTVIILIRSTTKN